MNHSVVIVHLEFTSLTALFQNNVRISDMETSHHETLLPLADNMAKSLNCSFHTVNLTLSDLASSMAQSKGHLDAYKTDAVNGVNLTKWIFGFSDADIVTAANSALTFDR
jgi:hypothetical protein